MDKRESGYYEALAAIAASKLRPRPDSLVLGFSEEFGDHPSVQGFCKKARRVPLKTEFFNRNWDAILLLPDEWYIYFLGQILVACISQPAGHLAGHFVHKKRSKIVGMLTEKEVIACEKVVQYLELAGTTYESLSARLAYGKARHAEYRLNAEVAKFEEPE